MKVIWTCRCYVGAPVWHGTEYFEPEECETTFATEVEEEDWNSKVASASCPQCGNVLLQCYDSAIPIVECLSEEEEDASA